MSAGKRFDWRLPLAALALLGGAAALASLGGPEPSDAAAKRLVETYNHRVIEAYRRADPDLVEGVAGPEEAKKILGLIGIKRDTGYTLDAELLSLEWVGVERSEDSKAVYVSTREEWTYRNRRIGTGEQLGDVSQDRYVMRYELRTFDGAWKVAKITFTEEPLVGRQLLGGAPPPPADPPGDPSRSREGAAQGEPGKEPH